MERTRLGWIAIGLLMAGSLALTASPATAQSSTDTVWSQLKDTYTVIQKQGYKQLNYVIGYLDNGTSPALNWPLSLLGGSSYLIAGVCDNDCTDFDLSVEDVDRAVLASDTAEDDIPMVRFTPPTDATYWVKPTMHACSVNPCAYGIAVFVQ